MEIKLFDKAPLFELSSDDGKTYKLDDFLGKWLVLYFYPKDNTSGCTSEACDFRDNFERITELGASVVGVSPDSTKSHANFRSKHNLNFALLSDESKNMLSDYGVWKEKSMYGRKYMGVERTTYIISPEQKIMKIYSKVKVNGHVEQIIKDLKELQAGN